MRGLAPFALPLLFLAATTTTTTDADAYSTRVHIMLANKVRDAVIQGNGTITLWPGDFTVTLTEEDAAAIIDEPEAFRAGAIGPDNMIFPGLTDPSHAIRQRPFEQCERLYEAAVLPRERAYAMGCFLHGSTDAIAHHFVNYMSGETFTLTPVSAGRVQSFMNVVRHIITEDMIQDAAYAQEPEQFTGDKLHHEIPKGFVLRTYFDVDSPVYGLMSSSAIDAYNAYIDLHPDTSLPGLIVGLDVAPADHLVLLPVYIQEIQSTRVWLRDFLEQEVAIMQDWSTPEGEELQVLPGDDGVLGTKDDDLLCSASCPSLFVQYFIYTGLLAPRYDAGGNELPPAWDKVSEKFGEDLEELAPSLVDTIENVSQRLNTGLDEDGTGIGDLSPTDLQSDFSPMTGWANEIITVDTQSIAVAVSPDWLLEMDAFFQGVGFDVDIAAWVEAIMEPVIAPIRDGIRSYVIDRAVDFIDELTQDYQAVLTITHNEYDDRLLDAKPDGLSGQTSLDHFYGTGLYGHAFNVASVALAEHRAVLPVGNDPVGVGPASFDCSHTTKWMQVGVCDYLARAVFPMGQEATGTLSVVEGGKTYTAKLDEDSPIECHDGSLSSFTANPTVQSCQLTTLDELEIDKLGTVSRAIPPELSGDDVECTNLQIAGLPEPPEGSGGNGSGGNGEGAGASEDDDGDGDGATGDADDSSGCDCRAARSQRDVPSSLGLFAVALGLGAWRLRSSRARSRRRAAAACAVALLAAGCGDDTDGPPADGGGGSTDGGAPSDGGGGQSPSTGGGDDGGAPTTGGGGEGGQGGNLAQLLIDALDDTSWSAVLNRDGRDRAYELSFDADGNKWAEIRNPFGPARLDVEGEFVVESDGETMQAVEDESGDIRTWKLQILPGNPRTLRVTHDDGEVEDFSEGYWPYPEEGLTAEVRVFKSNGAMADAYCKASSIQCDIDYSTMFTFGRGGTSELDLGHDIVAGSKISSWYNVPNFTVTDVDGFDFQTLGGTLLSDQYNFIVRYTGWIDHPGGIFAMREKDDDVGEFSPTDYGGLWVFLGDDVGSGGFDQLFLGVNAFGFCSEGSSDEPEAEANAGFVPVEIFMIRCNTDGPPVDAEMSVNSGTWLPVGQQPTVPDVSEELFPFPFQ